MEERFFFVLLILLAFISLSESIPPLLPGGGKFPVGASSHYNPSLSRFRHVIASFQGLASPSMTTTKIKNPTLRRVLSPALSQGFSSSLSRLSSPSVTEFTKEASKVWSSLLDELSKHARHGLFEQALTQTIESTQKSTTRKMAGSTVRAVQRRVVAPHRKEKALQRVPSVPLSMDESGSMSHHHHQPVTPVPLDAPPSFPLDSDSLPAALLSPPNTLQKHQSHHQQGKKRPIPVALHRFKAFLSHFRPLTLPPRHHHTTNKHNVLLTLLSTAHKIYPQSFREVLWSFGDDPEVLVKAAARLEWTLPPISPSTTSSTSGVTHLIEDWESIQQDLKLLKKAVHALVDVGQDTLGDGGDKVGKELVRFYDTMSLA